MLYIDNNYALIYVKNVRFRDISCIQPGSVHDATVLRCSRLFTNGISGNLPKVCRYMLLNVQLAVDKNNPPLAHPNLQIHYFCDIGNQTHLDR